jgi:hypothetical protein
VKIEFIDLILYAKIDGVTLGEPQDLLLTKFSAPDYIETYDGGMSYIHYGNVRISIQEGLVAGFCLSLDRNSILVINRILPDDSFITEISASTKLNEFIYLLQYLGADMRISTKERDYIKIQINKAVVAIYYLLSGQLVSINYSPELNEEWLYQS